MKIAVIGDAHLIADSDPYRGVHERRAFFKSRWRSFQSLLAKANDESPDMTILLGDLVDWFSPENLTFGLDLVSELRHPWQMTPGNYDIAALTGEFDQTDYGTSASRERLSFWRATDLITRTVDIGDCRLVLLDSALSDLVDGSDGWLREKLEGNQTNLLFTHVPVDTPETREYILSVDAKRSMVKYVLSGAPDLFDDHVEGRIPHVFSGHLHFAGDLSRGDTRFHLCNMGITMHDPHRDQGAVASATLVEGEGATT